MTILPNYGRKEPNLVCGRRWFHMVNKLNKIFITKVLPPVRDRPSIAG